MISLCLNDISSSRVRYGAYFYYIRKYVWVVSTKHALCQQLDVLYWD